ncbi:hypothetical protein [Sulfurimonas sp.]|uniref:hypothetical protein n=1 Tax=Sulfurimonas sp. TaxID=2022749 RepID=UPI002AAF3846|nr:hypothetical protein [Sulfurimonas sp.]
MYKKILILSLLLVGVTLSAEVKDKWKINLGTMFVTNFETEMQLKPKNLPISATINTKDQLGMQTDSHAFRLDGYYRFTDTHSIDFSYFSTRSDGHKTISQDIQWEGKTISAGAIIDSHFNMDIYKVSYGYSFFHNEKVELMLTAGFHITSLDLGLGAKGNVDGAYTDKYESGASATVPLPVFGFKGEYTIINETLFVTYKTEYFFMQYENYSGALLSSSFNLEYRFMDHVGTGVGYNSNKIFLKAEDGNKVFEAKNDLSGVILYLTYIY